MVEYKKLSITIPAYEALQRLRDSVEAPYSNSWSKLLIGLADELLGKIEKPSNASFETDNLHKGVLGVGQSKEGDGEDSLEQEEEGLDD